MTRNTLLIASLAGLYLLLGCNPRLQPSQETTTQLSSSASSAPGIVVEFMDPTVDPGDDFFRYVNGTWIDQAEIPADRSRWGSFDELRKKTDDAMLDILQKTITAEYLEPGSEAAKVADFYNTIMDTSARNELGITPIKPYLEKIDNIQNVADVLQYMQTIEPLSRSPFFGFSVFSSAKNSNLNILHLSPGAVGLPEREYYVGEDQDSKEKRQAYLTHVARMLQFIGIPAEEAPHKAAHILDLETKLAESQLTKEESRDARNTFHFIGVDQLSKYAPDIDWRSYLNIFGKGEPIDSLNLRQPRHLVRTHEILYQEDITTIKDYLRWTLLNDNASYLSMEIDNANFDFYGKTLKGLEEQRPLDERALAATNRVLGEALGQLYVAEEFPPAAKETAELMVQNIITAFGERIQKLTWMSAPTKERALEKLGTFRVKIGYPDQWKDYSALTIENTEDGGSYAQNMFNYSQWYFDKKNKEINKAVNKDEWFMSPQTVNAYYNPYYNEIVFPAAILQPPFFDFKADPAVNYGGIGAVIGHEISHGFDDSGSRFDANGNLNNWWTDEDRIKFDTLGKALAIQYDAYEPLNGIHVNGTFTLGENIGDLGGVYAAYDGLQLHLDEHGRYDPIDGFTPEQRFFISWATIWRTKSREEALKNQIKTDPHAPGMYRAIGPLVNIDAWYEAFDVHTQDTHYKPMEDRINIW